MSIALPQLIYVLVPQPPAPPVGEDLAPLALVPRGHVQRDMLFAVMEKLVLSRTLMPVPVRLVEQMSLARLVVWFVLMEAVNRIAIPLSFTAAQRCYLRDAGIPAVVPLSPTVLLQ
jgi:hypothetical protein